MYFLGKPHNPMINAGAILTASLLQTIVRPEMKHSEKFDWIMNYFKVSAFRLLASSSICAYFF